MKRPYHCESPACKSDLTTFTRTYYLDSPDDPCPLCGLSGHLVLCENIHLIVPDRYGPLKFAATNGSFRFLCHGAQRDFRLYPMGHPRYPYFYSQLIRACTCEDCLLEYGAKFINAERLVLG